MIVTIHGTHGSGKSTIVRKIMERFPPPTPIWRHPRRRPMGYILPNPLSLIPLFIPGHYEIPGGCGGCDTIPVVNDAYGLILDYASLRNDVLFEGILAQHYAFHNFLNLKAYPLVVLTLNTPVEECIADTQKRRADRGRETTSEKRDKIADTIIKEFRNVNNKFIKLIENGVDARRVSRKEAFDTCVELLKVPQ